MEKNRKIQIYCLLAASLVIGLFGAACLFLGIFGEYNDALGYFNTNSLFAPVVYCCMAAGPVLGLVGAVMLRDYRAPDSVLPGRMLSKVAYLLGAFAVIVGTAADIAAKVMAENVVITLPDALSWLLGAVSVAALVISSFNTDGGKVKAVVSLMGFATVFYCVSKVLALYFDQSVAVNSPIKFICQAAYLSYMLVFTAEVGLSLGKGEMYSKYVFALCTAVAVGGICSVAAVVTTVTGVACASFTGIDAVAKLGLFLYAALRLFLVTKMEVTKAEKTAKGSKKKKNDESAVTEADTVPEEYFEDGNVGE